VAGSCDHGNEPSVTYGEFLDFLRNLVMRIKYCPKAGEQNKASDVFYFVP
jgi:hypothetical protein